MKQVITIATMMVLLSLQAFADVTNEVIASLTYVGRSTESGSSIVYGSTLGSEVSAGLALPLDPNQAIFDNGAYHISYHRQPGEQWRELGFVGLLQWRYLSGAAF